MQHAITLADLAAFGIAAVVTFCLVCVIGAIVSAIRQRRIGNPG